MHGRVTALKRQQRRRDRVSVYLDGKYAFGLQEIVAARIALGKELSTDDVAELLEQEASEKAYERTLHFLSFRPRSVREVTQYLRRKDVDQDVSDQIVERLTRARLLDDRAFVQFWIENRQAHRPKGKWALRSELAAKGIDREIIAEMVEGLDEETDAMRAAERQVAKLAAVDDTTFRRRLTGYLQRRGFGYGVSRRIVEHYLRGRVPQEEESDLRA